jgi:hypothetical protein
MSTADDNVYFGIMKQIDNRRFIGAICSTFISNTERYGKSCSDLLTEELGGILLYARCVLIEDFPW